MKSKQILLIFIPAIALAGFALFASFIQYQPKRIVFNDPNKLESLNIVPIFKEDIIIGNLNSPKTIIAFEDLGCSRCQDQMKIFDELQNKYPNKIKIILKTLDVTQFPFPSKEAHQYLFCSNEQNKLNEFKKIILENNELDTNSLKSFSQAVQLNTENLNNCLTSNNTLNLLQKNEDLAIRLDIESVPAIFIDNKVIQEPLNITGWESLLSLNN